MERKDRNKIGKGMNKVEKELRILEEGPMVEIHLEELKTRLKIYQNGKPQALMAYTDFL